MFERRKAYNEKIAWSSTDEDVLLEFLKHNSFASDILQGMFPKRTLASLRSKTRKLRIKHDLFGESYRQAKMSFTEKYAGILKPSTVFEAYCGAGHQTSVWLKHSDSVFASDKGANKKEQFEKTFLDQGFIKSNVEATWSLFTNEESKNIYFYHGDAVDAAVELRISRVKIDLLDLDTCGSTLPLLPLLLNLLRPKYLAITHGEFHSMRFGRDDVLRRILFHRNIGESNLDLTVDELADELDKAVKVAALRCHNETKDSQWAELIDEKWLGSKFHGMLRRIYKIVKAPATSDCLNELIAIK